MSHQERSSPTAEFTDHAEAVMSRLDQRLHLLESNTDGPEPTARSAADEAEEFARAAAEEVMSKLNQRTALMSVDPTGTGRPADGSGRPTDAVEHVTEAESDGDEPAPTGTDAEVSSFRPKTVEDLQRRRDDNGVTGD